MGYHKGIDGFGHFGAAVNGLGGGDGHALLVGAELGVRGVGGVLLAALRAGALILVVGEIGEPTSFQRVPSITWRMPRLNSQIHGIV